MNKLPKPKVVLKAKQKKPDKCPHGKQKSYCVDCGGSQICEHKKQKSYCVDCGGSEICEHKRRKSRCVDCCGSEICEHKKIKFQCVDCGGSQICEHKKIKSQCVDCGGSQICIHKKHKSRCVDCGGSGICIHKKHKSRCVDCGGSGICEHKIRKSRCVDCGGSEICEHKRRKKYCRICGPIKYPHRWCAYCKYVSVDKKSQSYPNCFNCHRALFPDLPIKRRFMMKEHYLRNDLKDHFPEIDFVFNKQIDAGCSAYRPDVFIDCFTHVLFIENDENQHLNVSCENKRMMKLFESVGNRPSVFLRFNPDKYTDSENNKIESCFEPVTNGLLCNEDEWFRRFNILTETIEFHMTNIPEKEVTITYLFYDGYTE